MSNANFTVTLGEVIVSSSQLNVTKTDGFQNIDGKQFISNLRNVPIGNKDGSHYLRTRLKTKDNVCLPRNDKNTHSLANVLILDCDKRISNGVEMEGAPDPVQVSQILKDFNINHVLCGSHSHYVGNKGNRYRIIFLTNEQYTKTQLAPTVENIISMINSKLEGDLLANAIENTTWSQAWFYPRRPANTTIDTLYLEYTNGKPVKVIDPIDLPPTNKIINKTSTSKGDEISPIKAFNEQHKLSDLLTKYNFKKIYSSKEVEKWLSPNSTSGIPGITVKGEIFFSHHNDEFNDGYWHDSFDLFRVKEGLTEKDAVKKAALITYAPDGKTVDAYNKSLVSNLKCKKNVIKSLPIPHNQILNELLNAIKPINFRSEAKLDEDKKLNQTHLQIITTQTILDLAQQHNWGMCQNQTFIYIYNGTYWYFLDEEALEKFLGEAAEKMGVNKFIARSYRFRENLCKQFIKLAYLSQPERLKDHVFINLKNGTFQINPSGTELKSFNRDDFITYQLPFDYEPKAQAPQFKKYLDKVLPDTALQNILAEFVGYIFIRPSTLKLEKALLLYGYGANGKSVFYEIIRHLLGEHNTSEYSLQSLTDDRGYSRAMIANKLVNYASEINGRLQAAIFKQMVSGEPVEARLPYGNPFIMTDYAKLIFNCNELPRDVEQTEAYFRRFLIIPFNVTIPEAEQDKQLAKKIIDSELSGIFNWVLEGLNRLLKNKQFTDSEIARNARIQYEKESDSVKLFLDDMGYKAHLENYISVKILYREYRTYCQDDGYKPVTSINFRKRLEKNNILIERKNVGNVAFVIKQSQ